MGGKNIDDLHCEATESRDSLSAPRRGMPRNDDIPGLYQASNSSPWSMSCGKELGKVVVFMPILV